MGLKGSVGDKNAKDRRSENYPDDVAVVRVLLNFHILFNPALKKENLTVLPLHGFSSDMRETIRAIKAFQLFVLKEQFPTGRIDPRDQTIRTLTEDKVPGMPEVHANPEELMSYKLRQAEMSDEIEFMDISGDTRCLIKLLLSKDGNDAYFSENGVNEYIKNTPIDRPPPLPDEKANHLKNFIKKHVKEGKLTTTRTFIEFLQNEVRLQVVGGFGALRHLDEWTRIADDDTHTIGPRIAYRNLMKWFIGHKFDKKSVLYCLARDLPVG